MSDTKPINIDDLMQDLRLLDMSETRKKLQKLNEKHPEIAHVIAIWVRSCKRKPPVAAGPVLADH